MKKVKKMKTGGLIIAAAMIAAFTGCVQATVSEPSVCDSKSISFNLPALPTLFDGGPPPGAPNFFPLPALVQSTSFDFSDAVGKINDVANGLSVSVNELNIDNASGVFNWVQSIDVQVQGTTSDTPLATLASFAAPDAGSVASLNFKVGMDAPTVLKYLKSGEITLTVTIVGADVSWSTVQLLESLNGQLTTNVSMCVSGSGSFSHKF